MKRLLGILLTLFLAPAVFADPVEELSAQLDRLEGRFWVALSKAPTDADYREVRDMVMTLAGEAGQLQRTLGRYNLRVSCNIATEARNLQNLFASTKRSMAECYRTRFKLTRLSEYQRYARSSGLFKRGEAPPTLATLDIDHYRTWLDDLQVKNRTAFSRVSGDRSERQDADFRDKLDIYFQSYIKLRVALAEIRQEAARRELTL